MPFSADNLRFFAGAARTLEGKAAGEYVEGYTSIIRREPLGIVAGITPWNYPLMMVVWKLGPALAAGNVQILKPAEQTPLTTLRFVELAQEVLPPGVLQVVTGDGVPVGDALVRHPEIRLVSLTGDVETGKLIARERRATRSSASTSSSAARRRWSCSTTPTRPRSPRRSRSAATGTPARTAPPRRGSSSASAIYDDVLARDGQGASRR